MALLPSRGRNGKSANGQTHTVKRESQIYSTIATLSS
jgi:hypothetical protein